MYFSLPVKSSLLTVMSSIHIVLRSDPLSVPHSLDLQVKVRRRGSDTKFIAKVLAQGPECDIGELPHCHKTSLSNPGLCDDTFYLLD